MYAIVVFMCECPTILMTTRGGAPPLMLSVTKAWRYLWGEIDRPTTLRVMRVRAQPYRRGRPSRTPFDLALRRIEN
jgi:hypothetical protein